MTKNILFILTLLMGTGFLNAYAQEPKNLELAKRSVARYHDSGEYAGDLQKVINSAERYLDQRVAENNQAATKKKLALVLDIDETSLSNYKTIAELNFGGSLSEINSIIGQGTDTPIAETVALYRDANAKGVAVFFITGRDQQNLLAATEKNLKSAGYTHWQGLFLRPHTDHNKSIVPFKSSMRKKLEAQGYDIIENVGDQYSDLKGGYADATFKLPNPFYYLP